MRRERWYRYVPATYRDRHGVVRSMATNHWLPRYAYRVHHAHTRNEHAVYEFLQKNKTALAGDLGWIVHGFSVPKIAAGLGMAPESVRDLLRSLAKKHSINAWNAQTGKAEPRRRGDHGGTTSWRVPRYVDVLAARRADPQIGVGGKNGKSFWVFGSGKRFLTPEEVAGWGLENYSYEEAGIRSAVLDANPEEFTGPEDADDRAPAVRTPKATTSPPGKDPLPAPIKKYLKKRAQNYDDSWAKLVMSKGRKQAEVLNLPISDDEFLQVVEGIGSTKRGPVNGGYFLSVIEEKVRQRLNYRESEAAEMAAQATRFAVRLRESRIQDLCDCLRWVSSEDPEEVEIAKRQLVAAAPDELAEAMERMSGRAATA